MKGKMKLLAGALLATLALGVFVAKAYAQGNVPKCDELEGDLPPAEIVCDKGAYGRCQLPVRLKSGFFYTYECRFTGDQTDYCPMSIYFL